jgi:ABC-2 type transport system ATP-binding protein
MMNSEEKNFAIEVKDVYKSFKSVHAVNGVSFQVKRGDSVALLGPNGAGKTTIVEMVEGIQFPDKGEIRVLGKAWSSSEDELHLLMGIALQETRFVDKLTVEETLKLFASFYPPEVIGKKRIEYVIEIIGLTEKRKSYVVNLSGGQRQKLALGISILNNPKVLLLDEPTTGLDPNARREIWGILQGLKAELNTSLVLTTHYMDEAEHLCDHIIILDQGKIILEGNKKELLGMDEDYIIEFSLQNIPAERHNGFYSFPGMAYSAADNNGTLIIKNLEQELPLFLNHLKSNDLILNNFISRRKTLDDIFISLTGRHLNEQNN